MVIIRDDVVAWYELQREEESGNTYDEHAQNDGAITGATLSTDAPSDNFIGSFDFDGTNDEINASSTLSEIAVGSAFSVSIWFKADTTSGTQTIFASTNGTNDRFGVTINSGDLRVGVYDGSYTSQSTSFTDTASWHHLVVTWDGSTTLTAYLDNSSFTGSNNPTTSSTAGTDIGCDTASNNHFDGHIGQTVVVNKGVSSSEVSTLYNSGDGITYRSLFVLSDDLEAYYKLDGDATDATGNGNNGTVTGATGGGQGIIGTSYAFSGASQYISVPDNSSLDGTGDFAVGCWFKITGTTGDNNKALISKSTSFSSSSTNYVLGYNKASGTLQFIVGNIGAGNVAESTTGYVTNEWVFMVGTYESATGIARLYVNGVETDNSAVAAPSINAADLLIGAWTTSRGEHIGDIDEPFFMGRLPCPGEVRRLYSFGAGLRYEDLDNTSPLVDGVVSAYNFDGDVLDAKNNTYDGTNNGTTSTTGIVDNGRDFDGSTDYISLPTVLVTNGTDGCDAMSIGVWVRSDVNPSDDTILYSNTGSNEGFSMYCNAGNRLFRIGGRSQSGDSFQRDFGTTALSSATTYQLGGVWNYADDEIVVVVDGAEEASSTVSFGSTTQNLTQGYTEFGRLGTGRYWNGWQDAAVFWRRKLSSTEWNAFYNAGSGTQFPFQTTQSFTTTLTETPSITDNIQKEISVVYDESLIIIDGADSTGPNDPSNASNSDANWVNPGNIFSQDDNTAVAPLGPFPSGSNARDEEVYLLDATGTITGNNKGNNNTITNVSFGDGTPNTYTSYGGESDTWGASLTASDINDADFGVAFNYDDANSNDSGYLKAQDFGFSVSGAIKGIEVEVTHGWYDSAGTITVTVDHVRMTVYTDGGGVFKSTSKVQSETVVVLDSLPQRLVPTNAENQTLGVSQNDWEDISNVTEINDEYAFITLSEFGINTPTSLVGNNFGFSIDAGSTITGIKLEAEVQHTGTDVDLDWQLFDGTGSSSELGSSKTMNLTSSWQTLSLGGPNDTWSATLNPTLINSSSFGIGCVPTGGTGSRETRVRWMRITVYTDDPVTDSTEVLVKEIVTSYEESISLTDVFSDDTEFLITLSETVFLSDQTTNDLSVSYEETISLDDNRFFALTTDYSETVSLVEATEKATDKTLSETASLADTIEKVLSAVRTLSEEVSVDDSVLKDFVTEFSENTTLNDTVTTALTVLKELSETITATDDVQTVQTTLLELSETISLVDNITRTGVFLRTFTEGISLAVDKDTSTSQVLAESVSVLDADKQIAITRSLAENLSINDTFDVIESFFLELTETIDLTDEAQRKRIISLVESVVVSDDWFGHQTKQEIINSVKADFESLLGENTPEHNDVYDRGDE